MSVGENEEFPTHLMQFDEDLWNLVGKDFQRSPIRFSVCESFVIAVIRRENRADLTMVN